MGMLLDLFRNKWPYTDFHELNADWIISTVRELIETMDSFIQNESISFADPITWNISSQYAKATVVIDNAGNAYLSKQAVPAGIQLNNDEYWQEIFDFTNYTRTANRNLTFNVETNTTRATAAYSVDDWLILNDVLYRVTQPIAIDDTFIIAPAAESNIVHFTVEDFIKAWITTATALINQYKDDIDASELSYRQQLAQDIATTTASLQAQLNAAIAGATVDSEVIDARVNWYGYTYQTLGIALRDQIEALNNFIQFNKLGSIKDYIRKGFYIGSDLWVEGSQAIYTIIPISPGDNIKIYENGNNTTAFAVLSDWSEPTAGGTPSFSVDSNWNASKSIGYSTYHAMEFIAPSDSKYLYVYCGVNQFNRLPSKVIINGSDIINPTLDNINQNIDKVSALNGALDLSKHEHLGTIVNGAWSSYNTISVNCYVIPVAPDDIIEILTNNLYSSWCAVLTTDNIPSSAQVPFSSDSAWAQEIETAKSVHRIFKIPGDGHFLFILHIDGSHHNRLPSVIKINGIDIFNSTHDQVEILNDKLKKVYSDYPTGAGYINPSTGEWLAVDSTTLSYTLIPVTSGDIVTIVAHDSHNTPIAVLSNYKNSIGTAIFSSDSEWNAVKTLATDATETFSMPADARFLYVYNGSVSNPRSPYNIIINNSSLMVKDTEILHDVQRISLLQYNIGKYTWGKAEWHLETQAVGSRLSYDDYLLGYKKMLLKYSPDVVGIEEFLDSINVLETGSSPEIYDAHNMNDELWNAVYPYNADDVTHQRSVKSKFTIHNIKAGNFHYVDSDQNPYNAYYSQANITVGSKELVMLAVAFPYNPETHYITVRNELLKMALDYMKNIPYGIIMCDLNNGGNYGEPLEPQVSSKEEGELLLSTAQSYGFTFANGGYLPFDVTYVPNPGITDRHLMLDNIIYKNDGKIVLSDFEILMNEYETLSSDHVPIFAKFVLN